MNDLHQDEPRHGEATSPTAPRTPIRRATVKRAGGGRNAGRTSAAKRGGRAWTMTPAELRAAIAALAGGNQCRFARVCGVHDRTVRRWLAGDEPIPKSVQVLILALTMAPEPERSALVREAGAIERAGLHR